MYRTRVGPFATPEQAGRDGQSSEEILCACLNEWRDALMAGASLKSFQRMYPASAYKHFQDSGQPAHGADDFQSPTQPHRYIELRIVPAMQFYAGRIPLHTQGQLLKVGYLILGVASSVLARYDSTRGWLSWRRQRPSHRGASLATLKPRSSATQMRRCTSKASLVVALPQRGAEGVA